jgi:hypothetical protein
LARKPGAFKTRISRPPRTLSRARAWAPALKPALAYSERVRHLTGSTGRLPILALVALGFAYAYLVQPAWDNERAHYDLTRALAAGTPRIDESVRHPQLRTVDVTRVDGHTYATKAPGMAAASLPPYLLLRSAGADTTGNPKRLVWALHLWSIVLPAVALLLLVRWRAERVEPGFGAIVTVSLGAATLMLPFSTVFFSHVLSAAFGFAAFALLLREREVGPSPWLLLGAGLSAGLAFTVEYTLGVVAFLLGILVIAGASRLRRASLYCLGVAAGGLPSLAFNVWAFGSPFHLPQEGWHHPGAEPLPGLLGVTRPSLDTALRILFSPGGIAPILLPALVGAVVLWRRGARTVAVVPVLVAAVLFAFNASSVEAFGGASPGPRFMIPALPFLALPLAAAYRAIPGTTLGLAIGGASFMVAATLTTPLEAWDGLVAHRVLNGDFVESAANLAGLGGTGWDVLFLLALALAAVAALVVTPWQPVIHRDVIAGAVALCGWLLLANKIHGLLARGVAGEGVVILIAAATAAVVTFTYRSRLSLRPASSVQSTGTER